MNMKKESECAVFEYLSSQKELIEDLINYLDNSYKKY